MKSISTFLLTATFCAQALLASAADEPSPLEKIFANSRPYCISEHIAKDVVSELGRSSTDGLRLFYKHMSQNQCGFEIARKNLSYIGPPTPLFGSIIQKYILIGSTGLEDGPTHEMAQIRFMIKYDPSGINV